MKPRKYLTKSIFKIGLECPRKLYYLNKEDEYLNAKTEDPFLEALAQGGYQVGELAKTKYPTGIEIKERDHNKALIETKKLMTEDNAIIFEGAFSKDTLFVRADIAIKTGKNLRIIEVKSKSIDDSDLDTDVFEAKASTPGKRKLYADWVSYLYDLAFQVYVARLNYPNLKVSASLMLMDKTAKNPIEGLHQYFLIKQNGKSKEVITTKKIDPKFKGHQILKEVDLTELINDIIDGNEMTEFHIPGNIEHKAKIISNLYIDNKKHPSKNCVGSICKSCEFRGEESGLKSGFDECWVEFANIKAASSQKFSFDLWNFRGAEKALKNNVLLLKDLTEDDLGQGITSTRQLIQIEKHRSNSKEPWFDRKLLKAHIDSWTYPLHFIDFETCMPAIPFKKGFAPYSEIAFQFSHHTLCKKGSVKHEGQYINLTPGKFLSFDFLRELKSQLEKDEGTIFRYSNHENSVLNRIVGYLNQSTEPDKKELIDFVKTITRKKDPNDKKNAAPLWEGKRNMVDLLEIVKECYLSPLMGSSNSLKYVLPAALNESKFLQQKYSKPIYGTKEIPSLNFKDHTWIKFDGKNYSADPYKELPPIFSEDDLKSFKGLISDAEEIANGGAAMMAYCKCQFTEMSEKERDAIQSALLKYCELDTLAMVMLVEYWVNV